jgi:hypothetical protein
MVALSISGCGLVEGAFKAGVIFALIIVAIIGLIIWLSRIVISVVEQKFNVRLFHPEE